MPKSTTLQNPRPDFPLFPHATGRWANKVRGKFACFGKEAVDPKGQMALKLWNQQKVDLLAGSALERTMKSPREKKVRAHLHPAVGSARASPS